MAEQTKRFYNGFEFIGELMTPKDDTKLFVEHESSKSGWTKNSLKIGVKVDNGNGTFVNADAMIPPTKSYEFEKNGLKTGTKIRYSFADRNNAEVVDNVADFLKFKVDLEDDFDIKKERMSLQMKIKYLSERESLTDEDKQKLEQYSSELADKSKNLHKFVHELDFITFIRDNVEKLKTHKVRITGDYVKSTYKGKYYTNMTPKSVEFVKDDVDSQLLVKIDTYFDKDAVDTCDFKSTQKITVNGYVKNRDNFSKSDKFYPLQFVIDASKLDLEDETNVALLGFITDTFKVKGKMIYHIPMEFKLKKGAEQVEFTIDMLEPRHRRQVELGLKKLDDYRPKGGYIYGDSVEELRFSTFIDENFPDGAEEVMEIKEFEELIATSSEDIKVTNVEEIEEKPKNSKTSDAISKLFG